MIDGGHRQKVRKLQWYDRIFYSHSITAMPICRISQYPESTTGENLGHGCASGLHTYLRSFHAVKHRGPRLRIEIPLRGRYDPYREMQGSFLFSLNIAMTTENLPWIQ